MAAVTDCGGTKAGHFNHEKWDGKRIESKAEIALLYIGAVAALFAVISIPITLLGQRASIPNFLKRNFSFAPNDFPKKPFILSVISMIFLRMSDLFPGPTRSAILEVEKKRGITHKLGKFCELDNDKFMKLEGTYRCEMMIPKGVLKRDGVEWSCNWRQVTALVISKEDGKHVLFKEGDEVCYLFVCTGSDAKDKRVVLPNTASTTFIPSVFAANIENSSTSFCFMKREGDSEPISRLTYDEIITISEND